MQSNIARNDHTFTSISFLLASSFARSIWLLCRSRSSLRGMYGLALEPSQIVLSLYRLYRGFIGYLYLPFDSALSLT